MQDQSADARARQYAAGSPEEMISLDELLTMSGMEYMQALQAGRLPGAPIAGTLGLWLVSVEEGRVIFGGQPDFSVLNPAGTVHGGWYGTMLDSCMACAIQTALPRGTTYTTLEYKVNILRPIPQGTLVHGIGTLQHAGRSTGISRGEVVDAESGRVYATGSTTCLIMSPREAAG